MRYYPKKHILKDGRSCLLCSPLPSDAASIINLMQSTSGETDFMARYSDEVSMSISGEEQFLEAVLDSSTRVILDKDKI